VAPRLAAAHASSPDPSNTEPIVMPRRASLFVLLAIAFSTLSAPACAQSREYIGGRSASDEDAAPFSGAVKVGNTLYISGSLGLDPGQPVPATPEAEARNVLDNIKATLEAAGMTMDDLVSVQIYCSDVSYYDAFNAVYRTDFTQEYPARAFLGSGDLLFGARFEVMGIAVER
jgi:reactive intermediate/imine deaminase